MSCFDLEFALVLSIFVNQFFLASSIKQIDCSLTSEFGYFSHFAIHFALLFILILLRILLFSSSFGLTRRVASMYVWLVCSGLICFEHLISIQFDCFDLMA